jgi:FeS assembly SUF system protein
METNESTADGLREKIIEALHTVYDPEIPVDIYELGLVYEVAVEEGSKVKIRMTLTAPGCPVAEIMPEEVRQKALSVEGVTEAEVELVWDPPWNPGMMSEAARLALGF